MTKNFDTKWTYFLIPPSNLRLLDCVFEVQIESKGKASSYYQCKNLQTDEKLILYESQLFTSKNEAIDALSDKIHSNYQMALTEAFRQIRESEQAYISAYSHKNKLLADLEKDENLITKLRGSE
jgi:hypothetical protein